MRQWLLVALLGLGLGSCTTSHQPGATPRPWIRYYHREQRRHERQRRHTINPNITWSKL